MKKIFFALIILISAINVRAQKSRDEYKLMVDSAVIMKYTKLKALINSQNKYYLTNLYLINEQNQPLDYLRSSVKFKVISIYDSRNQKTIKKGIYVWKVSTNLNKNLFTVIILNLYITYKNHNYNFANGGGSEFIFKYDCDKSNWELASYKDYGI